MPDNPDETTKIHQTARQKQDRTDEAFKGIQGSEKRASDAKSARLKEARLKQDAEDQALPRKDTREARKK